MNSIFDNALDSLKVGMTLYMSGNEYSTRKHAILAVFHSIELLLKEYLYQASPILIYKNIDREINENSVVVGFPEILIRLKNLKLDLPDEQASVIQNLQSQKNRAEHYRYDNEDEDRKLISEAIRFALYFMELKLTKKPEEFIEQELLATIHEFVENNNYRDVFATYRLDSWLKKKWPNWCQDVTSIPKEFAGTDTCPQCSNEYLVMDEIDKPYCFWCCAEIPAEYCDNCGCTKMIDIRCCL